MARGNQRQIDRERARKRNAEKGTDNKRGQKSDFIKHKDTHAQIMRQKQKKFEQAQNQQLEEKPEKEQQYQEKYEE